MGNGRRALGGTKFYDDLALLEAEYARNPDDPRTTYYLGRTYEALGALPRAAEAYRRRVTQGGWREEVYLALWHLAEVEFAMRGDVFGCVNDFLAAHLYRPHRHEAILSLCEKLRAEEAWPTVYTLLSSVPPPKPHDDVLYLKPDTEWRLMEEFAMACYYTGRRRRAERIYRGILADNELGWEDWERVLSGLGLSIRAVGEGFQGGVSP